MAKQGNVTGFGGLTPVQVTGVLTAIIKTVNQPSNVVTADKGVGSYGLSLADLQLTGVVKCGFDFDQDLLVVLADPSVFTGKHAVNKIEDLLGPTPTDCESVLARIERERAERLQQELMNEVMASNINSLTATGNLASDADASEVAALAAQSTKFSPFELLGNALGTIGDVLGFAIDSLGALAALGALIAVVKNADILGKLKGFGADTASVPEQSTDTIDTADTDAGADSIVGSSRIASLAGKAGTAVAGAATNAAEKYIGKYI